MQWDWQGREIRLSVGELSRFSLLSPVEEGSGSWRMELGTHWHQVLRDRSAGEDGAWRFECPVSGTLSQSGWTFQLQGRIDQFHPDREPPLVREVKTVVRNLPGDEGELRELYPQYFHQAMLYAFLLGRDGRFPRAELLFLDIQTGLTQGVTLGEEDLEALHRHLLGIVEILEERRRHFSDLRNLVVPPPFTEWRPGQSEAREALSRALDRSRTLLFEAPTGFGKTGLALEQGLRRLAAGEVDRILLLTGKNTGHAALLKQLGTFRDTGSCLAVHALRSRRDLSLNEEQERLFNDENIAAQWTASGLSAPGLLAGEILDLEAVKHLGARHGIPPWAISRILLPYADVWIADFNYLFDPAVCRVPEFIPTWDPARTLLIIDEAHNLPDRAAASRSHALDQNSIKSIHAEVQFARFPGKMAALLDQLLSLLKAQGEAESLDPPFLADLLGLLREIFESLRESAFGDDELSPESRDWLWNLPYLLADWDDPDLPMEASAPRRGRVELTCLDASRAVAVVLERFSWTVLMSATLQPWEDFRQAIGLPGSAIPGADPVATLTGEAPWLEGCFEVLIDARVDTRYRQRERYLDVTVSTIGETALAGAGCLAVFFPSYQYAARVLEGLRFHYPVLRCGFQPRDLPLEEQTAFLEQALLFDDVLFLVLGSRFSEGIDALGGKIDRAIVVSPALPEVNHIQKARERLVPGGQRQAFRTVYLVPGLRKISQALGRLVRGPDQRARVLLHGKRFVEPAYRDLLPFYLQPVDTVVTDQDLAKKWLNC